MELCSNRENRRRREFSAACLRLRSLAKKASLRSPLPEGIFGQFFVFLFFSTILQLRRVGGWHSGDAVEKTQIWGTMQDDISSAKSNHRVISLPYGYGRDASIIAVSIKGMNDREAAHDVESAKPQACASKTPSNSGTNRADWTSNRSRAPYCGFTRPKVYRESKLTRPTSMNLPGCSPLRQELRIDDACKTT